MAVSLPSPALFSSASTSLAPISVPQCRHTESPSNTSVSVPHTGQKAERTAEAIDTSHTNIAFGHPVAHDAAMATVAEPRMIDTAMVPRFVSVPISKLRARYYGEGHHADDVGSVRTDAPIPGGWPFYYFEIKVTDAGASGKITIGLCRPTFQLNHQPGTDAVCVFPGLPPAAPCAPGGHG